MRKYGLIGYPLGHSFSKQYFADKFKRESITDSAYENYPLKKIGLLTDLIAGDSDISGLNVTIPFKSEVIKCIDWLDEEAAAVGAVNVIKISRKDHIIELKGFNTDIYGFRESIVPLVGRTIKNALLLGTGGSSKAVAYVLSSIGIKVTIVSRNSGPGCITYKELSDEILDKNQLIINSTPLGMFPDLTGMPALNYHHLTDNHILYDLVYNPEMTSFLKAGKERGCKIYGGLRMLHLQAEKAWNIWNDNKI
jgi:shikimate dehydrogenase